MRIKINLNSRTQLEFESQSPKDAIKELSLYAEVFYETSCGLCKSGSIRHEHRKKAEYDFFSLRCLECGARLDFGQYKDGTGLFAKRDKGTHGWYHYDKSSSEDRRDP